jgi:hypothetical protein
LENGRLKHDGNRTPGTPFFPCFSHPDLASLSGVIMTIPNSFSIQRQSIFCRD